MCYTCAYICLRPPFQVGLFDVRAETPCVRYVSIREGDQEPLAMPLAEVSASLSLTHLLVFIRLALLSFLEVSGFASGTAMV